MSPAILPLRIMKSDSFKCPLCGAVMEWNYGNQMHPHDEAFGVTVSCSNNTECHMADWGHGKNEKAAYSMFRQKCGFDGTYVPEPGEDEEETTVIAVKVAVPKKVVAKVDEAVIVNAKPDKKMASVEGFIRIAKIPDEPKKITDVKAIVIPIGEFSTKELAEKNGIEYPQAFLHLKTLLASGAVKWVRDERRNVKGKPTRLFIKTADYVAPINTGEVMSTVAPPSVAVLMIPEGDFSTKDLAEKNVVEYIAASLFIKASVANGTVKFSREERRAAKGPMTKLYTKV